MPDFMTEKEIEAYLVLETRKVPHPDGGLVAITAMRSLWSSLESVLTMSDYRLADIAGLANLSMAEKGYSYPEAFEAVVSYLHKELRRANGYRRG